MTKQLNHDKQLGQYKISSGRQTVNHRGICTTYGNQMEARAQIMFSIHYDDKTAEHRMPYSC